MSVCSVVLSKRIHVAVCGPIRTTFGTHMQIHIERVMCGKKNSPCNLGGTWGVLRHKKLINVGKLPNRWTDRHQIFHTYADSFRNEHRLNIFTHLTPKGGILGGGLGGQQFRNLGTLLNGWTDCHQILHMSADSPGNRHKLKKIRPSIPIVGISGVSWGKNSNV